MEWLDVVRQHIDDVLTQPGSRDEMARRAREFNPQIADEELLPMLDQLELFVRGTPDLIEAAAVDAEAHNVLSQLMPMLETAGQYFFLPEDLIPDHHGLYGLLDDAYLAQRYLLGASELHEQMCGTPLLGETLRPAVTVISQWIGVVESETLDEMVTSDLRKLKWKGALVAGALGMVAWQFVQGFNGTGGGDSWGPSWEAQTSQMAAGLGMSTPW